MPGAVTDIGNKVQEIKQELQRQAQIRAKEMTTPEGKTTMKNIDYVGKRALGQITAVIVLLVKNEQKNPQFSKKTHSSTHSSTHRSSTRRKRNCPWNKRTEQTNVIR